MPTNQTLEDAARMIEEFAATLNTEQTTCECCHVVKYENWKQRGVSVELAAIVNKLRRFANTVM